MRRGFTLLEVVVALAILGLALMAIFDLNSGAVASHAYAKRITIATMLARSKMTDIEQDLYDKGFDADDREIQGDFRPEGWEAYTWKAQILTPRTTELSPDKLLEMLFNLPTGPDGAAGLAALLGGGKDGGVGNLLSNISGSGGALAQQLQQAAGAQGGPTSGPLGPGASAASGLSALGPFAALAQTQMQQLLTQIQQSVREVHLTISWKEGKKTESIDVVNDVFSLRQGSDRNGTPGAALSNTNQPGVPGAPGTQPVPGQPPVSPFGQPFGGFSNGPIQGNTPPGTALDPQGRPIRQ